MKDWRQSLQDGLVIPAHPLALNARRKLEERRQRALSRYYLAAGAGGLAVGVHTTQFAIREAVHGLYEPVLSLAMEEMDRADAQREFPLVRIGGICGQTAQAVQEAQLLRARKYHAGLLSLAALRDAGEQSLLEHCRAVAEVLPLVGFYLQPSVGGCFLSYSFWRRFCELDHVVAIKIAPFNRYQTLDVVRAVLDSGREDIALYTGNDDSILTDLLTPWRFSEAAAPRRIVGGLLGHWAVWTSKAVEHLARCQGFMANSAPIPQDMLTLNAQVTDANAAFFDAANGFKGCIAGLHEVLRRQGLLEGLWCLDEHEGLSPGQAEEIDRVYASYPDLNDDGFVAAHLAQWLR